MNNIIPNTPNKRYSCSSEYGTPGNDDSDNSLYYSFVLSEEENGLNKENSSNGQWTVTDLSPADSRVSSRSKTPLLRKVLRQNFTPSNENKRRGLLNRLSRLCLTPEPVNKIAETTTSEPEKVPSVNDLHYLDLTNDNSQTNLNGETAEDGKKEQCRGISDSASDVTDDLENELQNTIIENPSSASKNKLTGLHAISQVSASKVVMLSSATINALDTKTVCDVLSEGSQLPQTKNATKIIRQRLANESRKSMMPRSKTYKRRSSIYEPRKIDHRKTLSVLKQMATKSIAGKFPTQNMSHTYFYLY